MAHAKKAKIETAMLTSGRDHQNKRRRADYSRWHATLLSTPTRSPTWPN